MTVQIIVTHPFLLHASYVEQKKYVYDIWIMLVAQ